MSHRRALFWHLVLSRHNRPEARTPAWLLIAAAVMLALVGIVALAPPAK
jgi:hypothetical protein